MTTTTADHQLNDTSSPLQLLRTRRSVLAKNMTEPGPSSEQLDTILSVAMRVPDHKKLSPWRFIVFKDDARRAFGQVLQSACVEEESEPPSQMRLDTECARFERAPLVIAVVSSPRTDSPIPEWEQILSTGAAAMNILTSATAMGFGAQWITEWYAYNASVAAAMGLAAHERIAGFIYIGTAVEAPVERARPSQSDHVTHWSPPAV